MKNLLDSEKHILDLVKENPEILNDAEKRKEVAERVGLSEKTIRNRIGELRKRGFLDPGNDESHIEMESIDTDMPSVLFIASIWRSKYKIARNAFIIALVMVAYSLMLPKTFKASSVILISKEENSLLSGGGLANMMPSFGLIGSLGENESMTYLAILKSRTVMEDAVNEFGLIERYKTASVEKAVETLRENTSFEINEENALEIVVLTKTGWFHKDEEEVIARDLAADIANYFSVRLDQVNKRLKTDKARAHRQFIEKRYLESIVELKQAEENLREFQDRTKIVNLPEQTIAMLDVAAMLQGEIYMKEIEKSVLKDTYSQNHPNYQSKVKEIDVLNSQLDSLNMGLNNSSMFPSLSRLPDLGSQYIHLYRELEIKNSIYNLITQEYENAKIQESKDTPTLQILDRAAVPEQKYKPQRGKLVILGFMLALFLSIYYYYFKNRFGHKAI